MPSYVALLRGINVGGNKKIAMADLRELLARLGFAEVRTLLQSGNAVFSSADEAPAALALQIEGAIEERLGLRVRCLVRSGEELRAVIEGNPLGDLASDGSKLMAHFLSETLDPVLLSVHDPTSLAPGQIVLGDRVIYQWCPDGLLAAPAAGEFAQKHLKVTSPPATGTPSPSSARCSIGDRGGMLESRRLPMKTKTVEVPEDVLALLKQSRLATRSEAGQVRIALAIYLFKEGSISIGKAAEIAGEPRATFELLLASLGIPVAIVGEQEYYRQMRAIEEAFEHKP